MIQPRHQRFVYLQALSKNRRGQFCIVAPIDLESVLEIARLKTRTITFTIDDAI
jgi:hypothetical protein